MKVKYERYECIKCGIKQPITFGALIHDMKIVEVPKRCECGFNEFNMEISTVVKSTQALEYISVSVSLNNPA